MAPRVTVVIPAHNAAEFIADSISSVARQSYSSWEIVVVDDGSSDGTDQVLGGFSHLPIRTYRNSISEGPASARNRAIAAAQGELVAFLDADDSWLPPYLERMVGLFDSEQSVSSNVGIVACDAYIQEATEITEERYSATAGSAQAISLKDLLRRNLVYVSALVPRNVLERSSGFDPEIVGLEDYDLWLRISEMGFRVVHTTEPLAIYRRRSDSVSSQLSRMAEMTALTYSRALARGRLTRGERIIVRSERSRQIGIWRIETALNSPSWPSISLAGWLRFAGGVSRLIAYGCTRPSKWGHWRHELRGGRITLWRRSPT